MSKKKGHGRGGKATTKNGDKTQKAPSGGAGSADVSGGGSGGANGSGSGRGIASGKLTAIVIGIMLIAGGATTIFFVFGQNFEPIDSDVPDVVCDPDATECFVADSAGDKAIAFEHLDTSTSSYVSLRSLLGQGPVLLEFGSTEWAQTSQNTPILLSFMANYTGRVRLVSLFNGDTEASPDWVKAYASNGGRSWSHILSNTTIFQGYGVDNSSTFVLLDGAGIINWTATGILDVAQLEENCIPLIVPGSVVGYHAPQFIHENVLDNSFFDLSSVSELVLLEFYHTNCGACHTMTPVMKGLKENYSAQIRIASIANKDWGETSEGILEFANYYTRTWPHLISNDSTNSAYAIEFTPSYVLIDGNGMIAWRHVGTTSYSVIATAADAILSSGL